MKRMYTPQELIDMINDWRSQYQDYIDSQKQASGLTTFDDFDAIDRENDPNYNGEYEYQNPDKIGTLHFH